MKMTNFLLLVLVLFSSCKKNNCPQQGQILDEGEIITNVLIQVDSSPSKQEYIIKSANDNLIGAKLKFSNQTTYDTIHFDNYSLLGKLITFTSGGIITRRVVTIDNENKLVRCSIEKEDCGKNKVAIAKHTWLLTKKIPDNYEVIFTVIDYCFINKL